MAIAAIALLRTLQSWSWLWFDSVTSLTHVRRCLLPRRYMLFATTSGYSVTLFSSERQSCQAEGRPRDIFVCFYHLRVLRHLVKNRTTQILLCVAFDMSFFGRMFSTSRHFMALRNAPVQLTVPFVGRRSLTYFAANAKTAQRVGFSGTRARRVGVQRQTRRNLSEEAKQQPKEKKSSQYGNDPNQTQLQTWTVAKGVKTGMTLSFQLGIAGLVLVCGGLIIKELIPTKMSPNAVFDSAFERLQREPRITNYFGKNLKAYGRDRSRGAAGLGKVEGRRNFVDHVEYDDENGVHHTRIMFNIEGSSRKGAVYADISKDMDSGDFFYLIVQDRANPARKWAIVDNRPQTPYAVRQGEIVEHLIKKGVVLYGSNSEPNTVRQLEKFGEACKQLNYVDCRKQPDKCRAAGIEALPTWSFNGQKEIGVKEIEDLFTRASKHQGSVFKNL